jgi:ribosomal protein L29
MKKSEFLNEVRGLDAAGLRQRSCELAEELMKLRFKRATGQADNGMRVRSLRLNLARIHTVIRQNCEKGALVGK